MILFRSIFCAAWFAAASTEAMARPNPMPKPSGIVVHLFGPGSITSGILPSFVGTKSNPGNAPAGAATANAGLAGPGAAPTAPGTVSAAPGVEAESEPTMDQVMHQMFVTGDPNLKPGQNMAPGRGAEHPLAVNP